jgi:hypothetical protein
MELTLFIEFTESKKHLVLQEERQSYLSLRELAGKEGGKGWVG